MEAKSQGISSGCPKCVAEVQASSTALPGPLAGQWIGSREARTQTGAPVGCWHHRWCLYWLGHTPGRIGRYSVCVSHVSSD